MILSRKESFITNIKEACVQIGYLAVLAVSLVIGLVIPLATLTGLVVLGAMVVRVMQ